MAPDLDGSDEPGADTDDDAVVSDDLPDDTSEEQVPVSAATRLRVLTFAALGSFVTGYAAIAALLALVTAMASDAAFTTGGVLAAALPGWLAAHQVPVSIFGIELGVLPLLPTIGVVAITARAAGSAAARLDLRTPGQARPVVLTVAVTHGLAGLVIATVTAGGQVTAGPLAACWYPLVVSAFAATAGVARRCGLLAAVADRADAVAVAGLRAGALAVALLLVAGGAVVTFGLLTSIGTARDLFPMGLGNALGMLLLSVGYLPNAIVAAVGFVAGPGFSLGDVVVAPLAFDGGPVPGLPLLAALPEEQAAWWLVLFALPLAAGIVVGRRLRDVDEDPVTRLRAVAVATGVVAVAFALLAGVAGGHLGRGPFDPVSMRAVAVSIALVLWTALPAGLTAWFGGPRPLAEHPPGLIDDYEEEDEEPADYGAREPAEGDETGEPEDGTGDTTEHAGSAGAGESGESEDEPEHELPGPRGAVENSGEVARD